MSARGKARERERDREKVYIYILRRDSFRKTSWRKPPTNEKFSTR